MNIDLLPPESEKRYIMYAFVNENNEVIWNGVTDVSGYIDHVAGTEYAQFQVWRRGDIVIVEACGWYSPKFHFRFELTELPDRVVILANEAAALMDRAHDEDSPARA